DLLNVSKIERGIITADIQPCDLRDIVNLAVHTSREAIEQKGLEFRLEVGEREITVMADPDKMIEAIRNVMDNAIKFTDKGSITVNLKAEERFGVVEISDTGKGIPDQILMKLFSKDLLLSNTPSPKGGSGLGLYVSKNFMIIQHGDIV